MCASRVVVERRMDLTSQLTKRRLEVDTATLASLFNDAKVLGEEGQLSWASETPEAKLPVVIRELYAQVRSAFNLRDEIKGFSCTIWGPPFVDRKKPRTYTIPPASFLISTRVLVVAGTRECFDVSTTKGPTVTTTLPVMPSEAVMTTLGTVNTLQYSFNDATTYNAAPRPGHRSSKVLKQPSKRYVILINGLVSQETMDEVGKKEVDKMTGGDAKASAILQAKLEAIVPTGPAPEVAPTPAEGGQLEPYSDEELRKLLS